MSIPICNKHSWLEGSFRDCPACRAEKAEYLVVLKNEHLSEVLKDLSKTESTLAAIAKLPDEWRLSRGEPAMQYEYGMIDGQYRCADQLEALIKGDT